MKRLTLITLSVLAIGFSSFKTSDWFNIKLKNPCDKRVSVCRTDASGCQTSKGVDAGKTTIFSVKKGDKLYSTYNGHAKVLIGKVDYKDQLFTCDCKD